MAATGPPARVKSAAAVREIRRRTRRKFSAKEKIRIVLDGLRGEMSVAELCRRELNRGRTEAEAAAQECRFEQHAGRKPSIMCVFVIERHAIGGRSHAIATMHALDHLHLRDGDTRALFRQERRHDLGRETIET